LWIGNQGHSTIPELSSDQLRHSGSPTPADTLVTAVGGPAGLALDSQGNMWVSSIPIGPGDTIAMYTPAARNAGGTSAPSRVLISAAINNAETIAFDNSGNLWMANCGLSQLIKFSASQLSAGGSQTPSATVTTSPIVMCPYALAFDNSGDLWVTDGNLGTHIAKYAAAQLKSTGNPTPVDTVGSQSGSLSSPEGLAFDANGNLWVANDGAPTVVEYTPNQLAAQGAPTPHVTITIPGSEPRGIAFDKRGTLWVADDANAAVYGLTSGQIGSSGSPAPAIADTITLNSGLTPQQIVFDPFASAAGPSSARMRLPPPVAATAVRRRHQSRIQ
jgi:secreted PhoX family phosphatase